MSHLTRTERLILLCLVPFYAIGTVLHLNDATVGLMLLLTPYSILLTSFVGFFFELKTSNRPLLFWALTTFLVTLALEIIGVATSVIFGAYSYGSTLGLQFFAVPLLIGINWTLIILGISLVVGTIVSKPSLAALVTASFTVLFDFVMEPVAIRFDYWSWEGGTIPLQNYVAWFCIAYLFSYLFHRKGIQATNKVPTLIVAIQFLFFLILRGFAL